MTTLTRLTALSLIAQVYAIPAHFNKITRKDEPVSWVSEVIGGLEELNAQDAQNQYYFRAEAPTAEQARKELLGMIKHSGLKGTIRFLKAEEIAVTEPIAEASDSEPRATEKQVAYLMSLSRWLMPDITPEQDAALMSTYADLTKKKTSEMIDNLNTAKKKLMDEGKRPQRTVAAAAPEKPSAPAWKPTDGMYKLGDLIVKVQKAVNGTGYLYAKVLEQQYGDKFKFVHRKGIMSQLRAEHKMTLEQAKEWGVLYGSCCVCGRTLTDENSIAMGIGPVCASKGGF